jgi:hypothetical protein
MPHTTGVYKIRRPLVATGGIDITGDLIITDALTLDTGPYIAGSITNSSGSMTISASGVAIGASTKITKLLVGTANVLGPSFAATTAASAGGCPITVLGAAVGQRCWVMATSVPTGLVLTAGSPATNMINLKFATAGCTAVAEAALTIQYLVFAP